jgi:hypothetical protein
MAGMGGARRVLALLVFVVMLQLWVVKAFYLPGVAPQDFAEVCLFVSFFPTLLFFLASVRYFRLLLTEKEPKSWERPSPRLFYMCQQV